MGIHSFQISLPPTRKRAKYVPDGAYLTRSCAAVGCQTFSSDTLTHALPSVQHCSNKCDRGSRCGADTPLRKRQNNANYRACAPVGSKMNASRGVKSCRIERDSREPRERVFSLVNAGIAQLVEQLICNQQVVGSNPTAGSLLTSEFWGICR